MTEDELMTKEEFEKLIDLDSVFNAIDRLQTEISDLIIDHITQKEKNPQDKDFDKMYDEIMEHIVVDVRWED